MVYTDGINKTTSHKEAVEMGIEKCITFEDIEAPIGSEERKFNEKAESLSAFRFDESSLGKDYVVTDLR